MRKPKSIAKLKKELDKVFNAFIRYRDFGMGCLACGESIKGGGHASHFYASTFTAVRWDERNVNLCCVKCNVFLHGNLLDYRKGMIQKYGHDVLEDLEAKKNQVFKLEREWLIERIEHYKHLLK